jgi:hypothetical protein
MIAVMGFLGLPTTGDRQIAERTDSPSDDLRAVRVTETPAHHHTPNPTYVQELGYRRH